MRQETEQGKSGDKMKEEDPDRYLSFCIAECRGV